MLGGLLGGRGIQGTWRRRIELATCSAPCCRTGVAPLKPATAS